MIFTWTCRSPCRWYHQKWVCPMIVSASGIWAVRRLRHWGFIWHILNWLDFSWQEQRIPEAGWKVFSFHGGVVICDFFQAACLLLCYETNLEPDEPYSNTTFVQHRLCQSPFTWKINPEMLATEAVGHEDWRGGEVAPLFRGGAIQEKWGRSLGVGWLVGLRGAIMGPRFVDLSSFWT